MLDSTTAKASPVASPTPSPARSRGASPAPADEPVREPLQVNHDALELFGLRKPKAVRKPLPPAPPKPMPRIRPQPLVDPDVATAFAAAGMPVVRGSLAELAAKHITCQLRDMLHGRQPSSAAPVPFHEPLERAFCAAHKDAVNKACYLQLADIRDDLVSALSRHCDRATAVAAASQAQPIIVWNATDNEHGWDLDLDSGGFVDALWKILGGRNNAALQAFEGLMAQMRDAAREPLNDVLFASEERFRDLVDRVAAIIVEAQQRK